MASIRSNRIVIDGEVRPARIAFDRGVVTSIDSSETADHDFGDLVVMAGLVDSHVHVNDPGRQEWEGFESATRAAAAGGTTTIVDMPLNSIPPTVSVPELEEKRRAASGHLSVDVGFWGGIVPGSAPEQLDAMADEGVCGFKAFLVDSGVPEFPPVSVEELSDGLERLAELGLPALIHAEDDASLHELRGDPTKYRAYLDSRPVESEVKAIEKMAGLVDSTGANAHILHISSGEGADAVGRSPGLSGETCPHYLSFAAEEIPDGATLLKCAPPIRGREHREALWDALVEDRLSMVVSDHSPAPPGLKGVDSGDFSRAWGGISSLQLRLPAVWDQAAERGLELPMLAQWLAAAPARLAGLDGRKGSIEVGLDADFVVWDPESVTEVRGSRLEHRHPLTPYEGMRLRGRVVTTLLGGSVVFENGTTRGSHGRMLRRR